MRVGRSAVIAVLLGTAGMRTTSVEAQEARALWVTRFDYDSEAKIAKIMEVAGKANFNIVYFQARAAGDAYYRSEIEPCAARLCGKLGGTPTYDPLEVAVREGHKHGLQVHAYLNALTGRAAGIEQCTPMPPPAPGNPRHVLLDHPEWIMSDRRGKPLPCPNSEEYIWLSPGFPEVRTQLARVAADVARRYAVDGFISIAFAIPATTGPGTHQAAQSSEKIRQSFPRNGRRTGPSS